MPTFNWKCECGEIKKTVQKHSDAPPKCPKCDKEMKKDFNYKKSPGVKFNGNGYYDTDKG